MVREARSREKKKIEECRRLLAESRSGVLSLLKEPVLDSIPGLTEALDSFVSTEMVDTGGFLFKTEFSLDQYRNHILSIIGPGAKLFSAIDPMIENSRRDKV